MRAQRTETRKQIWLPPGTRTSTQVRHRPVQFLKEAGRVHGVDSGEASQCSTFQPPIPRPLPLSKPSRADVRIRTIASRVQTSDGPRSVLEKRRVSICNVTALTHTCFSAPRESSAYAVHLCSTFGKTTKRTLLRCWHREKISPFPSSLRSSLSCLCTSPPFLH